MDEFGDKRCVEGRLNFDDMSFEDEEGCTSEDCGSSSTGLRKGLNFDFVDDCDVDGGDEDNEFASTIRRSNLRRRKRFTKNMNNNTTAPEAGDDESGGHNPVVVAGQLQLTPTTTNFSPCRTRSGRIYIAGSSSVEKPPGGRSSAIKRPTKKVKLPTPVLYEKATVHRSPAAGVPTNKQQLNLLQKDLPNSRHRSGESDMEVDDGHLPAPPPLNYVKRPVSRIQPASDGPHSPPVKQVWAMKLNDAAHNKSPVTSPVTAPRWGLKSRLLFTEVGRRASAPLPTTNTGHEGEFGVKRKRTANVNPFTPTSMLVSLKKARKSSESQRRSANHDGSFNQSGEDEFSVDEEAKPVRHDGDADGPAKRLRVTDINISRYEEEFIELEEIASGSFGKVKVARHRLDGMVYAIKVTRNKIMRNTHEEKVAMNEVFAHSALMKHKHVVRYYNSWVENGRVYIQNEYCEGGSLAAMIKEYRKQGKRFLESELKRILLHVAKGLQYIHSKMLVHLDVKPENIFITLEHPPVSPMRSAVVAAAAGDECEENDDKENGGEGGGGMVVVPAGGKVCGNESTDSGHHSSGNQADGGGGRLSCSNTSSPSDERVAYKIGDLGHVASIRGDSVPEEGDCRYMAPELLAMDVDRELLPKADIFSLGLTLYEAASLRELPKNSIDDPAYERIKSGNLPTLDGYSKDFNALLKNMVHPDPLARYSANRLVNTQCLRGTYSGNVKSRSQLYQELKDTKAKLKVLEVQLSMTAASSEDNRASFSPKVLPQQANKGPRSISAKVLPW